MNDVRRRALDGFQGNYLALMSIVQGAVIALLFDTLASQPQTLVDILLHKHAVVCRFTLSLLLFIMTWHEYWMGTTCMRYVPSFIDSAYPFVLGTLEFAIAIFVVDKAPPSWWFYTVAIFFLAALGAFINLPDYRPASAGSSGEPVAAR